MRTYPIEEKNLIEEIIRKCQLCWVGMVDDNNEPYVLPMNFGYEDGVVYLHSAPDGRCISILESNPKVCISFCTDPKLVWQNESVACSYRMRADSVIGKGDVVFEDDYDEKVRVLNIIMKQYSEREFTYSEPAVKNVKIWKVSLDEVSAKEFGVPSQNVYMQGNAAGMSIQG